MAEQTIDELNVEVNSKAKGGSSGLDRLVASVERLKQATSSGISGMSSIANSFDRLNSAVSNLKGKSGTVSSLVNSMSKLNDVHVDSIYKNINTLTQSLKSLGSMDPEIKSIVNDLGNISRAGSGDTSMNALKLQAQAAKTQATIDQSALKSAKAQQGLQEIADKNRQIEETARAAATQEQELTDSINHSIQEHIAQYGSAGAFSNKTADLGAVMPDYEEKTPVLTQAALNGKGAPYSIDDSVKSLKSAMGEVGETADTTMGEVAEGGAKATGFIDRLKQSFSGVKEELSGMQMSSNSFFSMGRFYGWYFILRQVADTFGGWINNINSFIENQNLFSVAMGKSAQSGRELANSLQSVLGIDSGEAMRYMGLFQNLTTSFGDSNKQATVMSKNLTQLGYDLASFYNISTESAFDKLRSGITGQVRAIRDLGIDTSTARLQQELYDLGIKEKVRDLTEADKAELRYIAIMKQTTNAQGDMARTIQTPANALRVLQAQLIITGRAIGSIFIPALEAILPVVTAVVEVIGDFASELAATFGFQMPKIDYSTLKPVSTDLSGVSDSADDASKGLKSVNSGIDDTGKKAKDANKEVRDLISGFDELNILNSTASSSLGKKASGSSGEIPTQNLLGGINLPEYDSLSGAIGNRIDGLKSKIKDFLNALRTDPLTTFSDLIWGVGDAFGGLFGWLSKMDYADILNGITAAITTYGLTKNPALALAIGAITTVLSHLMPQQAKIDMLSGSLAALGGALMLKQFTGMKFSLAFMLSSLVTSGLVKLIGKDNAINALASSLTGLSAGLLAYSWTGNLPLAVGIGAATAAVSGLAIHFGDMKIAPALLSGVAGGLLAVKLGMKDWTAGIVGIGVALTTFAEINNIAPQVKIALLGIAGAVTALGLAFQAGFGPVGIAISAVVGGIAGLVIGIQQAKRADEEADLKRRFGDVALSAQDVEDVAKRLTTTSWTVKIDAAISAKNKVAEFEKSLKSDIETLNKMNWEVSIGLKLTKSEMSTYKQTISSFISDAESYVKQQQYSVTLAIDAILEPGSATAKNLTAFTTKYYSDTQLELDKLGTQLSNEVNKAFADNVLTEGEVIKIQDIQKKMNDLLQKIADQKYQATLESLELDTEGTEIDAKSFQDLQSKIQSNIQDELKQAQQSKITVIERIETQYQYNKEHNVENAAQIRDKALQDAQEGFNNKKATLELSGLNISLNTLNKNFKDAISASSPFWERSIGDIGSKAVSDGWAQAFGSTEAEFRRNVPGTLGTLERTYSTELSKLPISSDTRAALKSCLDALKPTVDELEAIANSSKKVGTQVPENVAKGLADVEQLGAIAGNEDAINYMLGKKLSTDTSFLNTLATVKDAGKNVDSNLAQGITDNIQFDTDAATGAITGIRDATTGRVIKITPTLKQNLSDLGINMSNSLVNSTSSTISGGTGTVHKAIIGWWGGKPYYAEASNAGSKLGAAFTNGFRQWLIDHGQTPVRFNFETGHLEQAGETGYVSWHANGGVFDSPSIIGVGEAGPEAVVPLSENSEWIDKVASTINKRSDNSDASTNGNEERLISLMRMAFAGALREADGNITVPVNVNMDSEKIAEKVYKVQKKSEHRYT